MAIQFPSRQLGGASVAAQGSGATAQRPVSGPAREFESILLNQWLQDAESGFGSAPGGNDESETGDDQMKGLGTQQLATFMAANGGIGIARMVDHALQASRNAQNADVTEAKEALGSRHGAIHSLSHVSSAVVFSGETKGGE
jgi:Rod binding domain-containing protein